MAESSRSIADVEAYNTSPLTLRRILADPKGEPTKAQVLARAKSLAGNVQTVGPVLKTVTGIEAYNTSRLNLRAILAVSVRS